MSLSELKHHTASAFQRIFGRQARWIAAAPGRVNVIGEHTDYNDGFVLPMAIDRYTVIAAAPSGNPKQVVLRSGANEQPISIDLSRALTPAPKGAWWNYPLGVVAGFVRIQAMPAGFDAYIHSTVPLGGGLSSSAALEVATATLIEAISCHRLDPVEKALLCQKAEHEFAGMPCGIMDQFVSVMGRKDHLLLLDCKSRETELVPLLDPHVSLLITNTNVKHELTGGEYAQRRAQCEQAAKTLGVASLRSADMALLDSHKTKLDPVAFKRARHVISEINRTTQAAKEIKAGDWEATGRLMYASHASLRDDYEVSCAELDAVVDLARNIGISGGVFGCRMTGGGFGGCTVALVQTDKVDSISKELAEGYQARTSITPSLFVSRPADGATLLTG